MFGKQTDVRSMVSIIKCILLKCQFLLNEYQTNVFQLILTIQVSFVQPEHGNIDLNGNALSPLSLSLAPPSPHYHLFVPAV